MYVSYLLVWWLLGYTVFFWQPLNVLAQAFTANVLPGPTGNLAIVSAFLGVVLVRTLRIVRERAAIANEIEAARTMQQLLLGSAEQPTPGFTVESAYLPAGEVGGDFFLVSPCVREGEPPSLTVIVGDVSGKGMRAAMQVSMILGVLRREPSREPAAMLCGLNEALVAEGDTGFTTACCVRLAPDGHYSVANAGHISPYVAGVELVTEPALPLGLAPGTDYPLLEGRLLPGQRLVLLSDGVVEARTAKGELYGFARLGPLTLQPAKEIAATAQNFGQDDDITVLTIGCMARVAPPPPPPPRPAPPPMVR
jgi:serine phosphatase RsbU (regulator of sigma subunit)